MSFALLLLQAPILRNIPGVPFEYIPTQGAQQAWGLYQKAYLAAWGVFAALMAIAYVLNVCGVLADMQTTWYDTLLRGLLAAVLLSTFPNLIFGTVIGLNNFVANQIVSEAEIAQLNEEFREAAQQEETARQEQSPFYQRWFEKLAAVTAILTPGTAMITELFLAAFTILFYVSVILIMFVWRLFVIVLFIASPLLIVLTVLPKIGPRIGGAWITSLLQLGFWLPCMALLAFMVRTADSFFQPQLDVIQGRLTVTNHYESIAIVLGFALLYLSLPFMVNWLLPISRTSAGAALGLAAGTQQALNFADRVVSAAKTAAGAVAGGGGGAAAAGGGGGFQRVVTQNPVTPASGGSGGGGGAHPTAPLANRGTAAAATTPLNGSRPTRDLNMPGGWR